MVARNPFELFIFPAVNDPTMRQGITQSRSPSRFKDFDSVLHSLLKTICIRFFLSLSIVNNRPSLYFFPKSGGKKFDRAEIEILSLKIESAFWLKRAFFKLVVLHGGFYI